MKKLLIAALVFTGSAAATAEPPMAKYNKACAVCHAAGVAGAPKTHDAAAWEPRLAKGMDTLVKAVNNGLNAMPPKGMCFDCTDEDYEELITFMSSPAE